MSRKIRFGMLMFSAIFLLATISGLAQTPPSSTSVPAFTLELVAPSSPFKLGEPIHLKMRLTNTTDHVIYLGVPPGPGWGDEIVGIDFADSNGVPVLKWRDLEKPASGKLPQLRGRSVIVDTVQPREVYEREVRLEKVFKITEPGHYSVRVGRGDTSSHTLVKSETIRIDIVPSS